MSSNTLRYVTGPPGSGKSYYVVKYLYENYIDHSTGSVKTGFTIISNIDGLKLDYINLDQIIREHYNGDVTKFFTVDVQTKVAEKYGNIIYAIDECQRYFDDSLRSKDVQYFFEWSRHTGIEIILMTQLYKRLHRYLQGLEELHVNASRASAAPPGFLAYRIMCGYEQIDSLLYKKDKKIFALYKSFDKKSHTIIKNPMYRYFLIAIIFALIAVFLFYKTFSPEKKSSSPKKGVVSSSPSILGNSSPVSNMTKKVSNIIEDDSFFYPVSYTSFDKDINVFYRGFLYPLSLIPDPVTVIGRTLFVKTSKPQYYIVSRTSTGTNEDRGAAPLGSMQHPPPLPDSKEEETE